MNKKIAIFSPFLNPVGVKEATFGLSKKFSENSNIISPCSILTIGSCLLIFSDIFFDSFFLRFDTLKASCL